MRKLWNFPLIICSAPASPGRDMDMPRGIKPMQEDGDEKSYRPRGAVLIAGVLTLMILFTWVTLTIVAWVRS